MHITVTMGHYWFVVEMNRSTTLSLPDSLLRLIDEVRRKRRDPTRSDTVRVLILQALAAMSYLPSSEKKALGVENLVANRRALR